ncbi:hypothetical protein [Paenibacillus piri]|uniref:Uncharacterized protein n=1 Tax=Paenibacillus piri TaxID=2547395 RepID=A0A4R5KWN4_9BACL|nr:hypothetical protein [Paenibacillus piri]TDG00424.1 hypothetical protein E1757_01965 [Paenibacillus piri]
MTQYDRLCPWCQTEIVWDPELGPEDTCPHCLNELGEYRSVSLKVKQDGQQLVYDDEPLEDDDIEDDDLVDLEDDEGDTTFDEYVEGTQRVLDLQEEAPECTFCQSFMLLAGSRTMGDDFTPLLPGKLKEPLVKPTSTLKVYVCPSCFKVEHMLGEDERLSMIELLRENGK